MTDGPTIAGDAAAPAVAEHIVALGGPKRLCGIASLPPGGIRPDRPAIVILNTGIIHRVGNNRLSVTLARQLARWGHLAVRFDLAGLGDSPNPEDSIDPVIAALTDIRDTVDWVVAQGASRVILLGLCAGADHSIFYAGRDPRVAGAVLLDPSIPPTRRFVLIATKRRLVALVSRVGLLGLPGWAWQRLRRFAQRTPPAEQVWLPVDFSEERIRFFYEGSYRAAIAAGQQIFALFTSDYDHRYNYRTQILNAFPTISFGRQLRLEYGDGMDHNFTLERHREVLLDLLGDWLVTTDFTAPLPVASGTSPARQGA